MLTTLILNLVYGFVLIVTSPLRLLSDVAVTSGVVSAFADAGGYIKALDVFIPTATLLIVLGIVLTVEGYIFSYKGIMWVIKRIPTQS